MDASAGAKINRLKDKLDDMRRGTQPNNPNLAESESLDSDPNEEETLLNLREALDTIPPPVKPGTAMAAPTEGAPPSLPIHVQPSHMPLTQELVSRFRHRAEEDAGLLPEENASPEAAEEATTSSAVSPARLPLYYASVHMAPIAFCFGLAAGILGPVFIELLKSRVCAIEYQNDDICLNLSRPEYQREKSHVTSVTAHYSFLVSLVGNLPCAFFAIFTGSWSDHFGRKLPMMVPYVGMILSAGLLVRFTYISTHPAFLLFVPLVSALFGGWIISSAAIYSYIGDYSSPRTLAIDITVFDGIYLIAANIGTLVGGVLYGLYGFTYPFLLYGGLLLLTFLYILLSVRDRRVLAREFNRKGCQSLFTTKSIKENKEMLVKQRQGQTRFHIFLLLICITIAATCSTGNGSINQLFFEASPLNWSLKDYTIFSCVSGIITNLVMIAATPILKNVFGLKDTLIGIVGVTSTVFSYIVLSACEQSWLAVVSATMGAVSGLQYVATRALLSNWVDPDERGKMMSVIASLQALVPILGSFLFTTIFAASLSWWPGFSYAMASLVMLAVLAGYCYIDLKRRGSEYVEQVAPGYPKIS